MKVVILVPWRSDDGARAKVWEVCRQRWEALFPDWLIVEGISPDGPFNRSAAINHAARRAGDWDVAVVIDADVMLQRSNVLAAVELAADTGKVTWAHRRWRGMTQEATERLTRPDPVFADGALGPGGLATPEFTADIDLLIEKTTRISWSCCIAIRRDAWETLAGFDERFAGWGFEDGAFAAAAGGLVGWNRIEGDVLNLWHPRIPGAGKADRDRHNRHTAQALVNGRLGMRYMVALRRDHGLTDRPERAGDVELARDIGNLQRQDEAFARDQSSSARQEFDGRWPTLEELRDQAREYNASQRTGSVTVVMTSGGTAETWPERSAYLRRSLASLNQQVGGPIVQRVIYSDWPEELQAEVAAIASEFGFYVVGGQHVGYTEMRQRLWRYLARRAQGSYIFSTEDDFLFTRPVDLQPMIDTLASQPHLVQVALLRDACYEDERQTGGILGWPEPAFTWREGWVEHRLFFTANSSLFRRSLTDVAWPSGRHSETLFGKQVLNDPKARAAFWGDASEPWITHLGEVRAGSGY